MFLGFYSNVAEVVEVVCPSKEISMIRILGGKDCGKDFGKYFGAKSISQHRRNRGVKSRTPLNLVLGQDISLQKAMDMENWVVVGKARGINLGPRICRIG
jgi:hypothetical protein